MKRLSFATMDQLPPAVRRPAFAPRELGIGIVHIGLGAFHRAHQAVYTDDAVERGGGDWGIAAVSLRSPKARSQLQPQDGLFVVEERSREERAHRLIGSLREALFAPEQREQVLTRLADGRTRVVSLTITEKGYRDPDTIRLLVDGLARRMDARSGPVTLLPCDNLPSNGRVLKAALLGQLEPAPRLAEWVERHVAFPSTMVDRIVPSVSDDDLTAAALALGLRDEGFVACEPFRQWVIEDRFAAGRPAWELAGVQLVADVSVFERMKLRLLNASHSALAYLGQCAGLTYLHEVIEVPEYRRFVEKLMDAAAQTVDAPGVDLGAYRKDLLDRFANSAALHRTAQIAQDGSLKVPVRLLATARDCLEQDLDFQAVTEAVALWLLYLRRAPALGLTVVDPSPDPSDVLTAEPPEVQSRVREALARLQSMPDFRALGRF